MKTIKKRESSIKRNMINNIDKPHKDRQHALKLIIDVDIKKKLKGLE